VAALAVHVRRLFHGFALRTAVFLSVTDVATAIGMRALLVVGHWWLLLFWGGKADLAVIVSQQALAGHPAIRGNLIRPDRIGKLREITAQPTTFFR
jgi:hypothetical protein